MQDRIPTLDDTPVAPPSAEDRLRLAREALQQPALPRHRRSLLPLEIACLQERQAIDAQGADAYAAGAGDGGAST